MFFKFWNFSFVSSDSLESDLESSLGRPRVRVLAAAAAESSLESSLGRPRVRILAAAAAESDCSFLPFSPLDGGVAFSPRVDFKLPSVGQRT